MAPPRRIVRQQLEILMDFLEENRDMSKGLVPGTPVSQQKTKQKWSLLAKYLNAVQSGALKTPDGWKKYWFEWRHKCRKKAANIRRCRSESNGGANRLVPLNDLELRVLELSGKGDVTAVTSNNINQNDDFLAEDSDSESLEMIKVKTSHTVKTNANIRSTDDNLGTVSPPPKWALEFEERRLAAEERMAESLESMASIMRAQEERRGILEERIADAVCAIAGTVQDLNSGVQEVLTHLQHIHPLQGNRPGVKNEDLF